MPDGTDLIPLDEPGSDALLLRGLLLALARRKLKLAYDDDEREEVR